MNLYLLTPFSIPYLRLAFFLNARVYACNAVYKIAEWFIHVHNYDGQIIFGNISVEEGLQPIGYYAIGPDV